MEVTPDFLVNLVVSVFLILLLFKALVIAIDSYKIEDQQRILTSIAIGNGILFAIGTSPLGVTAAELTALTPWWSADFPDFITTLIDVGTVLNLLLGGGTMAEKKGVLGAIAFVLGLSGGTLLMVHPLLGAVVVVFAFLFEEVADTRKAW